MQEKIQGKFYPLQHQEWLRACRELTKAELEVLYYIRTIDPRNYGVEINAAEIARQLSSPERQVHRQTVSRALKELDAKGFIDLELLQVKVKVKAKGLWCDETPGCVETPEVCEDTKGTMGHQGCVETPGCDETPGCAETPSAIATHHDRSLHTAVDRDTPSAIATHHAEAETLTQQKSQILKINKSYIEFIKTLSEDERANFLNFCSELTANLSQPVNDIEAWLAHKNKAEKNRWEVYYQKFLGRQGNVAKKSQSSRSSQMMKKFQLEIEQQQQQAIQTWEESQV